MKDERGKGGKVAKRRRFIRPTFKPVARTQLAAMVTQLVTQFVYQSDCLSNCRL